MSTFEAVVMLAFSSFLLTYVLCVFVWLGLRIQDYLETRKQFTDYWDSIRLESRQREQELRSLEERIIHSGKAGYRS